MKPYLLTEQEQARTGFTHKYVVTYTDLNTTASTSATVLLDTYTAGVIFLGAAYKIVTNLDGGATSATTLKVGWDGATTDDDDGLIAAVSVHADGTPVAYGDATGAAFATLRTGYAALDAGNLNAVFTATGANLTALTQGEVHIFVKRCDLTKF